MQFYQQKLNGFDVTLDHCFDHSFDRSLIQPIGILHTPTQPLQVSAAPKQKREQQTDPSQRVEPETVTQKAAAAAASLLADASSARTSSIKLSNLEYADQLSKELLNHAMKLERNCTPRSLMKFEMDPMRRT